jgi:CRP/FNR family cyclic AMP-dependent transcriptional regulator
MEPKEPRVARGPARRAVSLLDADPDLGEGLSGAELELARRRTIAEVISYPPGPWAVAPDQFDRKGSLGLFLVDGLLVREVTVGDYTCAELLGPGDVLQPWARIGPEQSIATEVDWDVVEPVTAAVLDRGFTVRVAPWPEIPATITRRVLQRAHWLAFHLAVCGLRRVDDRLLIVLWHFADRWGTVSPEGVKLDVRLTHGVLASVIGARRPSVSSALRRLTERGLIAPRTRSRWLLRGAPPAELQAVHSRTAPRPRPLRRATPSRAPRP